jgi:hypothetical protein
MLLLVRYITVHVSTASNTIQDGSRIISIIVNLQGCLFRVGVVLLVRSLMSFPQPRDLGAKTADSPG